MAIYHFHAEPISRKKGQSVVACAAYRAAENLYDQRLGKTWDYTRKIGVEYSEILAPPQAPSWVHDREKLWNTVEAVEQRKDAQLSRQVTMAMPIELSRHQQINLLRDFARDTFVSRGMVADVALHLDDRDNPHAHILLSTRDLKPEGFGLKRRDWNRAEQLQQWRLEWEELQNHHLARAGFDIRVDHRSFEARGLDLVPGQKIGISKERQKQPALPRNLAERIAEQREIAAENGRRIIIDPKLALQALTHMQATFTKRDVGRYLHTRTNGAEQFDLAYLKVTTSSELVHLGTDDQGRVRYTTREMLKIECNLLERARRLTDSSCHAVSRKHQDQVLAESGLSSEQRAAFEHVTGPSDLAVVIGVAGAGKSTMLKSARQAWEAAGYTVKGAALAGIAAENLESASGISSRTLASWEWSWSNGRDALGSHDVLVIDEAGLIGTRQLANFLEHVEKAGAKVVFAGDHEQMQAIEAGAAFRGIAAQSGVVELGEVRRQELEWQKEATKQFAKGATTEALQAYHQHQAIQMAATRGEARDALLRAWRAAEVEFPGASRLMLAYTRDEVRQLNEEARKLRRAAGELGNGEVIQTERGPREFAHGDRVMFLANDRGLGVRNGSVGTLEKIDEHLLRIRLDGEEGAQVTIDSVQYGHLEHGYATTVHKSQGVTVDRTFALATPHFDRHATYVALSRHRKGASIFYAAEDFDARQKGASLSPAEVRERFNTVLSRARLKDLAHDYLERNKDYTEPSAVEPATAAPPSHRPRTPTMSEIDALQQQAAENWRKKYGARLAVPTAQANLEHEKDHEKELDTDLFVNPKGNRLPDLEHPGLDDEFEL